MSVFGVFRPSPAERAERAPSGETSISKRLSSGNLADPLRFAGFTHDPVTCTREKVMSQVENFAENYPVMTITHARDKATLTSLMCHIVPYEKNRFKDPPYFTLTSFLPSWPFRKKKISKIFPLFLSTIFPLLSLSLSFHSSRLKSCLNPFARIPKSLTGLRPGHWGQ